MRFSFFKISLLFSIFFFSSCNLEQILTDTMNKGLDEETIVAGLREALEKGAEVATDTLGQEGGYWKDSLLRILLPKEVNDAVAMGIRFENELDLSFLDGVISTQDLLDLLGKKQALSSQSCVICDLRDSLIFSLNRAAEEAAPHSLNIFFSAIKNMDIKDGLHILQGDSTAARDFLELQTRDSLLALFQPMIRDALNQVKADQIWQQFVSYYNDASTLYQNSLEQATSLGLQDQLPSLTFTKIPSDLDLWTTEHGLDGLFYWLGKEETLIREDPAARVTDLLEEVFGSLDK